MRSPDCTDDPKSLVRQVFAGIIIFLLCQQALGDAQDDVRERLRRRIESAGSPPSLRVGDDLIYSSTALPQFYERRAFEPAWVSEGKVTPQTTELVKSLESARSHGLRPSDYHFERITKLVRRLEQETNLERLLKTGLVVDLELLCTDAFLIYGSHLLSGRVNPQTIDAEWHASRREADLAALLESAVSAGAVDSVLNTLPPPQTGYAFLRKALAVYRQLEREGGWPGISAGPVIKPGAREDRIPLLRNRLHRTGDLRAAPATDSMLYDDSLKAAVIIFQKRHGLAADGAVGQSTLATLNVPVEERILQILANLERWRWLPQDLGRQHLIVNIATFELDVNRNDTTVQSLRVIVGKSYRRTPVFSDRITYMVINPFWNVPQLIAVKDILPLVKANPGHLAENDFELLSGWGADMTTIDPMSVDWGAVGNKRFPYRLRQKPGGKNALGRIKFMFPNQFDVYLHDTPARGLFAKEKRDFSSGCIRVEDPVALAEILLAGDRRWTRANIDAQLATGEEQTIRLQNPMPIHILYWTAWCTADGIAHFRNDIYDRDRPLIEALSEAPPGAE